MNRNTLIKLLSGYVTTEESEKAFAVSFLELLKHPDAYQRYHLPGHITGSAWITDGSRKFILLTHHAKLNKWLQPGGHADGDEDILQVALREATEETGIKQLSVIHNGIFDIDIHTIPARNDFPQHQHYDVRFLLEAERNTPLILTEESHALAWKSLHELKLLTEENESIMRMVRKMKELF